MQLWWCRRCSTRRHCNQCWGKTFAWISWWKQWTSECFQWRTCISGQRHYADRTRKSSTTWSHWKFLLETRLVFDWRFRDEGWKRRARLVARELRSGDASNVSTFSPTAPWYAIRMLVALPVLHSLVVCVMDIPDACFQVGQIEFVLIQVLEWPREALSGQPDVIPEYWQLGRCLLVREMLLNDGQNILELFVQNMVSKTSKVVPFTDIVLAKPFCQFMWMISSWWPVRNFAFIFIEKSARRWRPNWMDFLDVDVMVFLTIWRDNFDFLRTEPVCPAMQSAFQSLSKCGMSQKGRASLFLDIMDCKFTIPKQVYSESEFPNTNDAKIFKSGWGVCIYMSQECVDIQHSVRTCKLHGRTNKISNGRSQETCLLSQLHQKMKIHTQR